MNLTAVAHYHTIIPHEVAGSPGVVVPVLYLQHPDGKIGVHTQLHEYLVANRHKSLTWKRTRARAVGLFWDFLRAVEHLERSWDPISLHRTIYRKFCEVLLYGSIDPQTKLDPLRLYWPPMDYSRARLLTAALEDFITWIVREAAGTGKELDVSTLAKLSESELSVFPVDSHLSTRFLIVASKLKQISMFSHLKNARAIASRLQRTKENQVFDFGPRHTSFDPDPAVSMDPDLVAAFLRCGFIKNQHAEAPEEFEDITAKMIFLLLAFGGLRVSEPFHLWFNDIYLESQFQCKVILRHPAEAETHILGEECLRKEYLAKRGLLPRNLDHSSGYHAGWKNLAVDKGLNAPVFWIHSGAEAEFSTLYVRYLNYRQRLMEQRRLRGLPDHPFLFVAAGEDRCAGVSCVGNPFSISAMEKAWSRALDRVGAALGYKLVESKENGTTPHAPRHFYGQVLADASIHRKIIQKAFRHRSVLSQATYTAPDFKRVTSALSEARKNIENGNLALDLSGINSAFEESKLLGQSQWSAMT